MKKILQLSPSDYWAYCTDRSTLDFVPSNSKFPGFGVMENDFEVHIDEKTPSVGLDAVLSAIGRSK